MLRYDVKELTGDGDIVWALNDVILSEHKTGKRAQIRLVSRWEFLATARSCQLVPSSSTPPRAEWRWAGCRWRGERA